MNKFCRIVRADNHSDRTKEEPITAARKEPAVIQENQSPDQLLEDPIDLDYSGTVWQSI